MRDIAHNQCEKEINRGFKLAEDSIADTKEAVRRLNTDSERVKGKFEDILNGMGMSLSDVKPSSEVKYKKTVQSEPKYKDWSEVAEEVNEKYTEIIDIEQVVNSEVLAEARLDYKSIKEEFRQATKLDGRDYGFLITATALQTVRWVIASFVTEKIDSIERVSAKEGENLVKEQKEAFINKNKDKYDKYVPGSHTETWHQVVKKKAPYDVIEGSKDVLGKGLTGATHRQKTLGHDPILGWIFGTADILTDLITFNNFLSNRVVTDVFTNRKVVTPEVVTPVGLFTETYGIISNDKSLLPAALVNQAFHFGSDILTKQGLPVPVISVVNDILGSKLYAEQFDLLKLTSTAGVQSISALISVLINIIIGLIHGIWYNADEDGTREHYEVRTRKILVLSNSLSTIANAIATAVTKNIKMLDAGGLIVTITRLFSDIGFIAKVEDEFIRQRLDERYRAISEDVDRLNKEILG